MSDLQSTQKAINFLENYNGKLFNDAFSTIRPKDDKFQIGSKFDITLNAKWCGDAEIVYTKDFYLHQLNDAMAYLDTGLSVNDAVALITEFYQVQMLNVKLQVFTYLVLRRITKDQSLKAPINELFKGHAPAVAI